MLVLVVVLALLLAAALVCALVGAAAAGRVIGRQRADLAARDDLIGRLEADLDVALRPRPASTTAERAVARVVRTATKVRERGIGGLLQSSIDDLQTWAASEREGITSMAASDGTVTLVFTDIEDSTVLNDRIGDAGWVRLLAAHDAVLRGQIERYRGEVVKTWGDGFMAAFRDPEAACRAAVGIQRDLRRTLDLRLRLNAPVKVRIGIHTGTVISRDGDYFGTNVAMAARVSALATGGEVLVSNAVHDALDDDAAVELVEMGEVELKGLPGSHLVWRVVTSS